MGRASWGGQQDISGMLSSLINENFNQIKAGVNEALGDAQDEQSAADQKTQAQWAAGKISDEKWLSYIRSRIQDSTDPTERGQWQGILLQNQDAISDAQWETRFQQNKISVGQLLAHYRKRMSGIQHNSPAYRELAGRNTELLQFKRSGGNYFNDQYGSTGGSGGGGGTGGGGGSYGGSTGGSGGSYGGSGGGSGADAGGLQGIINRGLRGGPTDVGYVGGDVFNTRGPNVVGVEFGAPAANTTASLFVAVEAGLEATQKTLKGFFDFIEANPKATGYTIPGTGVYMAINAKTVRAADEQYMRVTATLIDVLHKKGTGSALSEAAYQETQLGDHVTSTMRNHNAAFNQPNEDNIGIWAKRVLARMNAASTPAERRKIAREAGTQLDRNMEDNFPEYVTTRLGTQWMPKREDSPNKEAAFADVPTTLEEQLPPEVYESHAGLAMIFDVGANPQNYTDEDIDNIFDDLQARGDIGTGAGRIHLVDLLGNGGATSTIGGDSLGMGDFRLQHNGLKVADLIQSGQVTPDEVGDMDLYAYQWNSATNRMEPGLAVATPTPDGTFEVVPASIDGNGNISPAADAISYMSNVNGKNVEVWTRIISATPASGYVYRFGSDMTIKAEGGLNVSFKKGDLVPSSSLEALGTFNLNAYVQTGQFYKDTPPGIRQADMGGKTWYYDIRANSWFPTPPWDIEADKTDPNAIYVIDPDYIGNGQGGWSVDQTLLGSATDYITAPLDAGVEGYVKPFDSSMSLEDMQKWLETEIANGHVLPGEYKYIDADGNAVEMTLDQLMTSYHDPAVEARMETLKQRRINVQYQRGTYGQPAEPEADPADLMFEAKQDMRIAAFERAQAARPVLGPPAPPTPDAERDERMRHLQQVAFSLGIQTGVLPGAAKPDVPRVRPGIDDSLLRGVAIGAAQNRAKIARQPRLEPLPADPVAPRPKRQPLRGVEPSPPPIPMLRGVKVPKPAARPVAPEPLRHWAETF